MDKKQTPTQKSRNVLAHVIKKGKELVGDKERLPVVVIEHVIGYCFTHLENSYEASLLLATIFTGDMPSSVFRRYRLALASDSLPLVSNCFLLQSEWDFPLLKLKECDRGSFISPALNGWVALPLELEKGFQTLSSKTQKEACDVDSDIKAFLRLIPNSFSQGISLGKLKAVIRYQATKFKLSRAELAFIGNQNLDDNPHCVYGHFALKTTNEKLYRYIRYISNDRTFSVQPEFPNEIFGSFRVPTDEAVKTLFAHYRSKINNYAVDIDTERESFNAKMFMVVSYLEICTLHRPNSRQYNAIDYFDLNTGAVIIRDKGDTSLRVLPLCRSAKNLIIMYKAYLVEMQKKLKYDFKQISNHLDSILDGQTNLFNYWHNKHLMPYSQKRHDTELSEVFPAPRNWARHYVCSKLVGLGFCRDDIAFFMGHALTPDISFSIYSSNDLSILEKLSSAIEEHVLPSLFLGDMSELLNVR